MMVQFAGDDESASLDERCTHIHKRMDDAEHTA